MKLTIIKCKISYLLYALLSLGYFTFVVISIGNESGSWMKPTDFNDVIILTLGYLVYGILFFGSMIGGLLLLMKFFKTLNIKTQKSTKKSL